MPAERPTEEIFADARKAIERRVNEIRQACGIDVDIVTEIRATAISFTSGKVVHGVSPPSFELDPTVIFHLHTLGRLNLALEHEVLAPSGQRHSHRRCDPAPAEISPRRSGWFILKECFMAAESLILRWRSPTTL